MNITKNRKAYHDYEVIETIEAGIVLQGTEVKSCINQNVSLQDGYAQIQDNEMWLHNVHINPFEQGSYNNHDPYRKRKLLLHKKEIQKLQREVQQKGVTLIPLSLYTTRGKIKVSLGLCKGKNKGDKRETLKKKQADRDMGQLMKRKFS